MNLTSINKKKLFFATCEIVFILVCMVFVFFKALLDLVVFMLCCSGSDDDVRRTTGPYYNYATGELDPVKYPDGIYRD